MAGANRISCVSLWRRVREYVSFALPGLDSPCFVATAYAVGCIAPQPAKTALSGDPALRRSGAETAAAKAGNQ